MIRYYTIRCPAHHDVHPSLSVGVSDGKIVKCKCFAGCSMSEVLEYKEVIEEKISHLVGEDISFPDRRKWMNKEKNYDKGTLTLAYVFHSQHLNELSRRGITEGEAKKYGIKPGIFDKNNQQSYCLIIPINSQDGSNHYQLRLIDSPNGRYYNLSPALPSLVRMDGSNVFYFIEGYLKSIVTSILFDRMNIIGNVIGSQSKLTLEKDVISCYKSNLFKPEDSVFLVYDSDVDVLTELKELVNYTEIKNIYYFDWEKVKKTGIQKEKIDDLLVHIYDNNISVSLESFFSWLYKDEVLSISDFKELDDNIWLVENMIPRNELILIEGNPGCGKSFISLALSYAFVSGNKFICSLDNCLGVTGYDNGKVLIISHEDTVSSIKTRIKQMKADPNKFLYYNDFPVFPNDINKIKGVIERHDVRVVIIDPISSYLRDSNIMYSDVEIRKILGFFVGLCRSRGMTTIVVRHLRKTKGNGNGNGNGSSYGNQVQQGLGSIGFTGISRVVLRVDKNEENQSYLSVIKTNYPSDNKIFLFDTYDMYITDSIGEELVESDNVISDEQIEQFIHESEEVEEI